MTENARNVLAASWLSEDADGDIEWARKLIAECRDAEHCGDCANVPMTCSRCCVDEAFTNADRTLAALDAAGLAVVPKVPTPEMVQAMESYWAEAAWAEMIAAAPKWNRPSEP